MSVFAQAVSIGNGARIPLVGLGTWALRGRSGQAVIRRALDVGYRHLDTARVYRNEEEVGRAVRDSRIAREDVFITTKLPPDGAGRARETLSASLAALDTEYVDLWLIHWPPGGEASPETWRALVAARREGRARAIGVSNYSITQIDELIETTGEAPAVNQVKWSPSLHDPDSAGRPPRARRRPRGLQPVQEHVTPAPDAGRDRERSRRDTGAGRGPVAHPAWGRRDSQDGAARSPRDQR